MIGGRKKIDDVFRGRVISESTNTKITRIIGTTTMPTLDPFLKLDHFYMRLPGGFPDHPHRGFEALTYVMNGKLYHEDFNGHLGVLEAGSAQWMVCGKGIVHAEMPGDYLETTSGFQLWVNVEKKNKFGEPQYLDYSMNKIPEIVRDNCTIRVITGTAFGVKGPIATITPLQFMDVQMPPKSQFTFEANHDWTTFCYVFESEGVFGNAEKRASENQVVQFKNSEEGDIIEVRSLENMLRFILISGQPINEPISQYGPYVMTTPHECNEAVEDYTAGKNGFENAQVWKSKVQNFLDKDYWEDYILKEKNEDILE